MAAINGVSDRVKIAGACSSTWLSTLDENTRRLLMCDCEGYERNLFDTSTVVSLAKCDLIIELHPMYYADVKDYLYDLFKKSHSLSYVTSYDDARKMFDLHETYASLSQIDKIKLVQEGRSFSMDWMIARSLGA